MLWVAVVVFSIAAAVWAWTYPVEVVRVTPEVGLETVPGTADAGFSAFGRFVLGTGFLGLATATIVFLTQLRGPFMMLWTMLVVAFATWWFLFFGGKLVDAFHPVASGSPRPGELIEIASIVPPSVGLLFAPTVALLTYWVSMTFSD